MSAAGEREMLFWCLASWPGCTVEQQRKLAKPLLDAFLRRFRSGQETQAEDKGWRAFYVFTLAVEDFFGHVAIPMLYVPKVWRRYQGLREEFLRYFQRRLKEELGREPGVRRRDKLTEEGRVTAEVLGRAVARRRGEVGWRQGLSAGEVRAVERYLKALEEGARPGKGSLRAHLGEDYWAVMGAICRAKKKNGALAEMLRGVKESMRRKWLPEAVAEERPRWRWRGLVKHWCLMEGRYNGLAEGEVRQWQMRKAAVDDYLGCLPREAREREKEWMARVAAEYSGYWPEWMRGKFLSLER